jgi:hypothetical protein
VQEHARHPFSAVMTRKNPSARPEILCEDALEATPCPGWENPHGITVNRKASDMAAAVQQMLACCRWVRFIDPYISMGKWRHKQSLSSFFMILGGERPVGQVERIEFHTKGNGATTVFLKNFYEEIIPVGLTVTLFRWLERPSEEKLHNRYILTDLGGVSFHHGLDAGEDGEIDDVTRLDREQYLYRCKLYDPASLAFDQATPPFVITGNRQIGLSPSSI